MSTTHTIVAGIVIFVTASLLIPKNQIDNNIKPKDEQQQVQDTQVAKQSKLQDISDPSFYENMNIVKSSSSSSQVKKEEFKVDSTIKVIAQEAKPEVGVVKPVETAKAIPKSNLTNNGFISTAVELGVSIKLAQAMQQAANEYGIKPEYLLTIGLSENALAPNQIGDGGISFGAYQINISAHRTTTLNPSIMDCAKDFLCSSRWTANEIKNTYMVKGRGWIKGLSHHNSPAGKFPQWYQDKITKNGLLAGLTF